MDYRIAYDGHEVVWGSFTDDPAPELAGALLPARPTSTSATHPARPLLLVDVDGVLSLFGAARAEPGSLIGTLVDGIPHLLSTRAAAALLELAPDFECVWCTGWEDRADTHLPHALGLPRGWPHIVFGEPVEPVTHWKLAGIDALAGPERPLAWIDDGHDDACRAWASERPGPTLLLSTEPDLGLTHKHVARVRGGWAPSVNDEGAAESAAPSNVVRPSADYGVVVDSVNVRVFAVGARAQALGAADRLLERDRDRVVGDRSRVAREAGRVRRAADRRERRAGATGAGAPSPAAAAASVNVPFMSLPVLVELGSATLSVASPAEETTVAVVGAR